MDSNEDVVYGIIKYGLPDDSLPASERALYSPPANRVVGNHRHRLHDLRAATKEGTGLDLQGFTWKRHKSALAYNDWFEGHNIENIYAQEMVKLICEVTAANRAVVDGFGLRSRTMTLEEEQPYSVKLRGSGLDRVFENCPRNVLRVGGRDRKNPIQPTRLAHADFSVEGLRDTVRWARQDIASSAKAAIDAEDAGGTPRYAAYSVWRPLKSFKRDPLAVLDWRTVDTSELVPIELRALSGIREEGEYIRTGLSHIPPKDVERLKWYWMPDQQPDEVLILKFADTAAGHPEEKKSDIAAHCIHGSPVVPGTEMEAARESIECRIIAFFD